MNCMMPNDSVGKEWAVWSSKEVYDFKWLFQKIFWKKEMGGVKLQKGNEGGSGLMFTWIDVNSTRAVQGPPLITHFFCTKNP